MPEQKGEVGPPQPGWWKGLTAAEIATRMISYGDFLEAHPEQVEFTHDLLVAAGSRGHAGTRSGYFCGEAAFVEVAKPLGEDGPDVTVGFFWTGKRELSHYDFIPSAFVLQRKGE